MASPLLEMRGIDKRYPGMVFPMPGPGMFVEMLKKAMPPLSRNRCFCCGKGGNVGRKFMIDRAIQIFGAKGVCQDTFLASAYAKARTLRLADGPDEVHLNAIAKMEMSQYL